MAYCIDLAGKVAVVTGASKGIGFSTAKILTQAGAQVVFDDIVDKEEMAAVIDEISKIGVRPEYIRADISTEAGAKELIEETVSRFGRVDILVNNAGVVANWDKSWDVHVKGIWFASEAAKVHMAAQKSGRIVNLTSTAAFTGGTGIPQYAASKGGTFALTRFLARNYAPLGILVNGVAPAVVYSDMLMTRYESKEALLEHYIPQMPIRRIGYPEDIANIILFLCSELSGFMCGEILIADGGRMHVG